jgi:hypothetical protein
MALPESSYVADENEISEFRSMVQKQLDFINTQISDLSSEAYGPQGFIPLILAIVSFASIIYINWKILLDYWIPSLLVLILILIVINTIDAMRMMKSAMTPKHFQDIREFKIAFLLTLKKTLKNFKPNETAFFFVLLTGWLIVIYNHFEYNVEIDAIFFTIYTVLLLFYLIMIPFSNLLYELFVRILTELGHPFYEDIDREGFLPSIKHINFSKLGTVTLKNKSHFFYVIVYIGNNVLIVLLLIFIFLNFPKDLTWDLVKNVIHVAVFQFFTLITLMIFISFKLAKETYESQKVMCVRILTSLEHSKQTINRQILANGRIFYKISKLCYGQKVNFAVVFTKWMIEVNGELNVKENYDWLYQFLKIPEEPISN